MQAAASPKPLPVTLLTGFLGSGKTTLLAQLLASPALANTVVIVNEFGEVGIDHLLVGRLTKTLVKLPNGCLCCTIRGDLALTLLDLLYKREAGEVPAFDRVIVETSGLADPVPLAHTLLETPTLKKAVVLEDIVTVVDALHALGTVPAHETAADQVAMADLVLLSKIDLAPAVKVAHTRQLVGAINPAAELAEMANGEVPAALVIGPARFNPARRADVMAHWLIRHAEQHPGQAHPHDHGQNYVSHVCRSPAPLSLAGTSEFLDRVTNELAGKLLRIKGIAAFREKGGAPAVIHAVQNHRHPLQWLDQWPDEDHESRIVFVGRELDVVGLESQFHALCC